jgi:hypothetical protein
LARFKALRGLLAAGGLGGFFVATDAATEGGAVVSAS